MTAPRPALRAIAVALVLVLIASVSHVSALSETFAENIDENGWANMKNTGTYSSYSPTFNKLHINSVESFAGLKYVTAIMYEKPHATYVANMPVDGSSAYTSVVAKIDNTVVGEGIVGYSSNLNSDGTWKNTVYYVDFDYFDPKSFSGLKKVDLLWDSNVVPVVMIKTHSVLSSGSDCSVGWESKYARFDGESFVGGTPVGGKISHSYYTKFDWKNTLELESQAGGVNIDLRRFNCPSTIVVTDNVTKNIVFQKTESNDYSGLVRTTSVVIDLVSPSKTYTVRYPTAGPSDPTAPVTIYVKSSQTGALLAGAHLLLEGAPGSDGWTEYYNSTLESGMREFSLPTSSEATPYQYRVTASYPGYTERVPLQHFNTWGGTPRNIVIEMEPTLDAPTDPVKTILQFYVRDTSANPLLGAAVEVDGQWLYTNNNGYARFAVAKNATYPYSVSKSGYMTISGSATVEGDSSYTVNVVLGQGSIPTNPPATSGPGDTPGPGPTPDRRTNEEKGQAVVDMLADNAEGIGALALICLLVGLLKLMVKW